MTNMHVDFPTTYGFTWPINQTFKSCVTSEQETLHCCVVVPFIQRVPRRALLCRRRQPTVTKGVKGLARWRTAFSAPSCNERIRAGAKREEITRREQGRKVLRASRRNRRVPHSEPQCSVAWKLEVEQNEHLERPKARRVKTGGSSEAGSDNICRHRRGHLPAAVLCATT